MPLSHLDHLAFLVPGNYEDDDPARGFADALQLIALGERLGYDSAWVRQRHLERGISSAAVFLAAATQRTARIGLGTAVIQLGYEDPFRLAEDLATLDVLSGGRLNVGVSAGPPPFAGLIAELTDARPEADYGHGRAERLAAALSGRPLSGEPLSGNAAGRQVPCVRPVARGIMDRLWYGGGSLGSAVWAAGASFNLLTGNIVTGEDPGDFFAAQAGLIARFRAGWTHPRPPRVALGRVILPTDGASASKRRLYADFAAARRERTLAPQGPRRTLFAPDIVGTGAEILEALSHDPVLPLVSELRLELPYDFAAEDYAQVIADFAVLAAPFRGARRAPAVPRSEVTRSARERDGRA